MPREHRATPRAPLLVGLDVVWLGSCAVAMGWALARIGGLPPVLYWPGIIVAALLGMAAADLGTGLVHWAGDTFGDEDSPLLGPYLISGFREHHVDPMRIVSHGFVEVSGANALAITPLALPIAALAPDVAASPWAAAGVAFLSAGALTALLSNQLHRWAHMAKRPRLVVWLQRHRLILSRERHARHHRGAHDRAFCVANGWMNPLLDAWLDSGAAGDRDRPWAAS